MNRLPYLKISEEPLVSILIITYYRPKMLAKAVEALLKQTYRKIEIIIVDNGSTPETKAYLSKIEKEDSRIKLIHFETNQFSWDDYAILIRVCYNAAFRAATGELIFYQEDDDWYAPDFIERMVSLFIENPECTTAIGRCVNALPDGTMIPIEPAIRQKYISGFELALDYIDGNKKIKQNNPGLCFVMRRAELILDGGFQDNILNHQYFGILPFGVTGYDPDAFMYWRSHGNQLSYQLNGQGKFVEYTTESLIEDLKIDLFSRWKNNFGIDAEILLKNFLLDSIATDYFKAISFHFISFNFKEGFTLLNRFKRSSARIRMTRKNFFIGFWPGIGQTPQGRLLGYLRSFLTGIFSDPKETMKLVVKTLRKK